MTLRLARAGAVGGQQLITTAWSVLLRVVLVAVAFGWSGGKELVSSSYREAKERAPKRTRRSSRRDRRPAPP